ncbi:SDR family oxidoreductase [Chitinophaga sp. MM2321]|uniref:SDR family NAD(P)-dependent oxidoreductase n=1 Tax=Chitinophaga sp. MM2321 TaxID=3137178 RepID=UPI0032D58A31
MKQKTFNDGLFKNATAVVTGGTSGLGASTAIYLAELGAKVYAVGLKANHLQIPEGLNIKAVELDVTDESGVTQFIQSLESLDILFNGAGVNLPNQHDIHSFKKSIDINLNSVFHISTLARPLLAKSKIASIVNVSSMLAIFGNAGGPAYSASKGGVDQVTKSLAIAYAEEGIRVNAVAPGWINTPLLEPLKDTLGKSILDRTPFNRFGDPEEIAQVVAFLSSPAASFITGTILPIDGGYSIM